MYQHDHRSVVVAIYGADHTLHELAQLVPCTAIGCYNVAQLPLPDVEQTFLALWVTACLNVEGRDDVKIFASGTARRIPALTAVKFNCIQDG